VSRLAIAALLIAVITLLAFVGYWTMLGSGLNKIEQSSRGAIHAVARQSSAEEMSL
jgi:hypothetical protein